MVALFDVLKTSRVSAIELNAEHDFGAADRGCQCGFGGLHDTASGPVHWKFPGGANRRVNQILALFIQKTLLSVHSSDLRFAHQRMVSVKERSNGRDCCRIRSFYFIRVI